MSPEIIDQREREFRSGERGGRPEIHSRDFQAVSGNRSSASPHNFVLKPTTGTENEVETTHN